jgi:plastocyanin
VARPCFSGIWIAAALALSLLSSCRSPTIWSTWPERDGALVVELAGPGRNADASVLYLERTSDPRPRAGAPEQVDVTSDGAAFRPPLYVLRSGDDVRFVNRGRLAHLLFIADENGRREQAVAPGGTSELLRITRLGGHRFYCSLHPDESFAVFVSPSDHFIVPDGRRSHRIDGLAAGRYRLSWWSDAGVRSVGTVAIRPGETATRAITLSAGTP